jgi:hypothetical protein
VEAENAARLEQQFEKFWKRLRARRARPVDTHKAVIVQCVAQYPEERQRRKEVARNAGGFFLGSVTKIATALIPAFTLFATAFALAIPVVNFVQNPISTEVRVASGALTHSKPRTSHPPRPLPEKAAPPPQNQQVPAATATPPVAISAGTAAPAATTSNGMTLSGMPITDSHSTGDKQRKKPPISQPGKVIPDMQPLKVKRPQTKMGIML